MASVNYRFAALDDTPLPSRISSLVRDAILNGRWKPGAQIVESRVAKELGVGQNAVREALQQLEFQGFVTKVPNKGNFVTILSIGDIEHIYRARIELEPLAVKWARHLGRPNAEDCPRFRALLDLMEQGTRKGAFATYQKGDFEFHCQIWELSGNPYLKKALQVITAPQFSYILIQSSHRSKFDLPALVRQHREWLEFLMTASPQQAYNYTRKLTTSNARQLLGLLNGTDGHRSS